MRVPWLLLLTTPLVGQADVEALLRDLASQDAVVRETARRHLALRESLPETSLVGLLEKDDEGVVIAAATLLRDRGLATESLRLLARSRHDAVRLAVLPVASEDTLRTLLKDGSPVEAGRALYALEDRGRLRDDDLVAALSGEEAAAAEAACRVVVLSRSPFPVAVAERVLDDSRGRARLLEWLAGRPRTQAGAWLLRVLEKEGLTALERIQAITALPADWLDARRAKAILQAAAQGDLVVSNRAAYASGRFAPAIADGLVEELPAMCQAGAEVSVLLACLDRISVQGEKRLFEVAVDLPEKDCATVFHWLSSRDSKLVHTYVGTLLDESIEKQRAFPKPLVRLLGPALTTKVRISAVVAMLAADDAQAVEALGALIEAKVYHPAIYEYCRRGGFDSSRRLWRLLELPADRLPDRLFERIFDNGDLVECGYAADSLARRPFSEKLERPLLQLAESPLHEKSQFSAARALILQGREAAGLRAFAAMRKADRTDDAVRWLIRAPKPWSYETLLRERERLEAKNVASARPHLHRVLIGLAKLGDRGAHEALLEEIPRLQPSEMQHLQSLLAKFLKPKDLQKLAARYLVVKEAAPGVDVRADLDPKLDDERRVELLEWFVGQEGLDIGKLLEELWTRDESYEVRLVALRGLLARDWDGMHAQARRILAGGFGDDERELAFELIGGMPQPLTAKAAELLAHVVLLAPLADPQREIRLSIEQDFEGARGAYPLIAPAATLLRRDTSKLARAAFESVAKGLVPFRYALNRQRLGLLLASIQMSDELRRDLGPCLARWILAAPDLAPHFVGPAQLILAEDAVARGDRAAAAPLFDAASRAFCRGIVPAHLMRVFLGPSDPTTGYHPLAALAARGSLCRYHVLRARGDAKAARRQLNLAIDLAEGDADTMHELETLRRQPADGDK